MLGTIIGRVRVAGIAEGISFLLLLGGAMPLKYAAGMPLAVTVVGSLHGFLFLAYGVAIYDAHVKLKWKPKWSWLVFFCSLIPFGPFLIDGRLRAMEDGTTGDPEA